MRKRFPINCYLATFLALLPIVAAGPIAFAQGNRAATPGEVQIEGVLEILVEDSPAGARTFHFLKSTDRRYALQFPGKPPVHLRTGDHLRVRGVHAAGSVNTSIPVVGTLALNSDTTSVQTVTAAPAPNTLGAQKTIVILVNFQDNPIQPFTITDTQGIVFGAVSNFFLESSYQQTWLTGDVVGWYTIPVDSTTCNPDTIQSASNTAATASGVKLSNYARYVYVFPNAAGCVWSGMGTVGGNPSTAWINGNLTLYTVGHEMGHNFGLYHAHALECGPTTFGSGCQSITYGDSLDIMGGEPAHFNPFFKEQLGWLNLGASPPITSVQTSGTYVLDPYETTGVNPKALKILKSTDPTTGRRTWYYVEYRQTIASGSDWYCVGAQNWRNGVILRVGTESDYPNSSFLLDMTPGSSEYYDWCDAALAVGQSFSDQEAGVTISPQWATASNAGVSVSLSEPSCVRTNPTVTVSPSTQSSGPGIPVSYTVSVANGDAAGCNPSTFSLQATTPSGWTATLASPTPTISPGAGASTTLMVTSPTTATNGSYVVGVTATNSGNTSYAASAAATYVIQPSVSVTVATDRPNYTRTQTVSVNAKVSAGGKPVAGAAVNFTVSKSNGSVVTGKATTGTDGSAVYKLRLKRQDPVGTYLAGAVATDNALSGSAVTSFNVQ